MILERLLKYFILGITKLCCQLDFVQIRALFGFMSMCHVSQLFVFFGQCGGASQWRASEGATPSTSFIYVWYERTTL